MKNIAARIAVTTIAMLAPLTAAATPAVSPAAGTDVVLGMHTQREGQWQLEYRREAPDQPAETVWLRIAPDYHCIERGGGVRLYDFALRRIYEIRPDHHFVNNSLYADVWARAAEIENRAVLGIAMQKAGIDALKKAGSDPFWAETELGMTSARFPRPELKRTEDGGRTRWLLAGDEVVAVRYGKQAIPEAIKGSMHRLWPTFIQMHPQIVDEIAMNGRMPEELWVKTKLFAKDPFVVHWTLTRARWDAKATYPLPPHLNAEAAQPEGAFPEIFAALATNVAEKKTPLAQNEYATRVQAAIKNGDGLEAMLWTIEMSLASGTRDSRCASDDPRPFCALLPQVAPLVKADPRSALAFAQKSPDLDDRPQFDNLPNVYLLQLLWATRPPGKGVDAASTERDLLTALRARSIPSFCKDTGDFYAKAWRPYAAWQAYDLGRLMPGHIDGDLLTDIDSLEKRLAADKKEFF